MITLHYKLPWLLRLHLNDFIEIALNNPMPENCVQWINNYILNYKHEIHQLNTLIAEIQNNKVVIRDLNTIYLTIN